MSVSYVTHEESMIQLYIEDPELAELMLQDAITEGNLVEVRKIKRRMSEAKARSFELIAQV